MWSTAFPCRSDLGPVPCRSGDTQLSALHQLQPEVGRGDCPGGSHGGSCDTDLLGSSTGAHLLLSLWLATRYRLASAYLHLAMGSPIQPVGYVHRSADCMRNAGGQQGTAMGSCVRSMSTVPCLWQASGPHLGVGHACTRWRTWTSGQTLPYLNQDQLDVHRVRWPLCTPLSMATKDRG